MKLKSSLVRLNSRRGRIALLCLGFIFLFSILYYRTYSEIRKAPALSWRQEVMSDCGVVLTGSAGRIREGISLLSRGFIKKLIISGVHPDVELKDIFYEKLIVPSIQEDQIYLEKRSSTTYGNAQQTWPIVEVLGCQNIVLITTQLHMPRAYKTFLASFPEDYVIHQYILPTTQNEMGFLDLSTEVLKSIFYSIWAY